METIWGTETVSSLDFAAFNAFEGWNQYFGVPEINYAIDNEIRDTAVGILQRCWRTSLFRKRFHRKACLHVIIKCTPWPVDLIATMISYF
jgi:hypothetical protein